MEPPYSPGRWPPSEALGYTLVWFFGGAEATLNSGSPAEVAHGLTAEFHELQLTAHSRVGADGCELLVGAIRL